MRITLSSILVEDQDRALAFYRDVLGFVEKENMPAGGARWITLASPQAPDGARISLEPAGFPWARDYQRALKENGVPLTAFAVDDLAAEHARRPPPASRSAAHRLPVTRRCRSWRPSTTAAATGSCSTRTPA